jgi:HAMP domain-containing protein
MNEKMDMLLAFLSRRFHKRGAKIIVILVLMAVGMKNAEIQKSLGTTWNSLRKYRTALDNGDIESLFEMDNSKRQKSEMEKFNAEIDASFSANPPKTLREARERIKEITGLERSINRVRKYLLKRGSKIEQ